MYRVVGTLTALVLIVLTGIVAWQASGRETVVVPTGGVAAGPQDDPRPNVYSALVERTQLQRWPGQTTVAAEPATPVAPSGADKGPPPLARVQGWLEDRSRHVGILRQPEFVQGQTTVPGRVTDVLQQPEGRTWRRLHNDQIVYGGGIFILGLSALIALFLAWRGRIPIDEGFSGSTVLRFSALERANHWLTATSFLLMALTGLVVLYGRYLIMPWLGAGAFSGLAEASAWLHMVLAVPFVLGALVMGVLWTRQNLPGWLDWNWIKHGGGFLPGHEGHPPARRFNAGQKLVFWAVMLGGLALLLSGLAMMFPFFWFGYDGMQWAQSIHAIVGVIMVGLIIGHIYIGTAGMEGAFDAMWDGRVDRNWAKEHHSLWYREITGEPAPASGERLSERARP
jgi:formate dehydrogenase subunit gamma